MPALKYRAFLSYSHADTKAAQLVHKRLEAFHIDQELVGRETARGAVPRNLQPIFRDRHDFEAGGDLADLTLDALDSAAALIVLSSPSAARSHYVNEEVRLFKSRHPERPVIPLIIDGTPGHATDECFPPALRHIVRSDGTVTPQTLDLLAADLRNTGDGATLALSKIVARLLGLEPDEIYRRAERERRRQGSIRTGVAIVIGVLAIIGGGFFWQSREQQASLAEISALVEKYSPVSAAEAAEPGTTRSLTAALTAIVDGAATDPRYAQALALLKAGKAQEAEPLLKLVAEDKAKRATKDAGDAAAAYRNLASIAAVSDHKRAREYYAEAARLDPADTESRLEAGRLEFEAGHLELAEADFLQVLALASADRDALCRANFRIGRIDEAHGNLKAELGHFQKAASLAEKLVETAPSNADWQRDLAVTSWGMGDVLFAQGNLPEALKSYQAYAAIVGRLTSLEPTKLSWPRELGVADEEIGDVLVAQGNQADALKSYRQAKIIREKLTAADPQNAAWQDDLSVSYSNIGDTLYAQNDMAAALKSYEDGMAITEQLARSDPENARWQASLATWYEDVADVRVKQGDLAAALTADQASMKLRDRLSKSDPENTSWQHDLAISISNIADVMLEQGRLADALQSYQAAAEIREGLVKADPSNVIWQEGLAETYRDRAVVLAKQGKRIDALQSYEASLVIFDRVVASNPTNADWQQDLIELKDAIQQLRGRQK